MSDSEGITARSAGLGRYVWVLAAVWTVVAGGSLVWNLLRVKQETLEEARTQARMIYAKDILYRRWVAGHGGVYVPVTAKTPPSPYLSRMPDHIITTPSGKQLMLINPAYMTRQVHEMAEAEYGIRGHITSLKPIRPQNAPDPWETKALQDFERGQKEVSSVEQIDGQEYMRLMRPFVTEKGCLKCHAAQGYREGDIRGGVSASVPMGPLKAIAGRTMLTLGTGHLFLWLMGVGGIVLGTQRLRRKESDRSTAAQALQKAKDELQTRVEERTSELRIANEQLREEITERKAAEEYLELAASRWESTFDAVEDMVAVIGTDYRILLANKAMREKFKGQDVLGGFCYQLIHGTDAPPETCRACKVFETGEPARWEIQEEHLGGCWLDVAVSPIKDESGKVRQIVHSVQDITERKQAEREIKNLAKFPSENPDPVLRIARDGTIIFANNAAHPLLDAWSNQGQEGAALPRQWSKLAGDVLISGQRKDIENEYNDRTFLVTFAPVIEAGYVNLYARDITKRKQAEGQLRETLEETVDALASVLEQRDPYTSGHQRRVAQLACAIAEEMGLGGERIDGLRLAGVIHDVGKISVPAEILSKPTRLKEMEFNIIKTHSQAGHDVLKKIKFLWPIAQMVLQHHERMDGSGYPQGLSGEDILLEARILAVADVVEAMSSHRPYRPALGIDKALSEISEAKGTLYDPDVVDACLKLFREKGFKLEIEGEDSRTAGAGLLIPGAMI